MPYTNEKDKEAYRKAYYQAHRAEYAAYRKVHRAKALVHNKAYYDDHQVELVAYAKAYRQEHQAEIAARKRRDRDKAYEWETRAENLARRKARRQTEAGRLNNAIQNHRRRVRNQTNGGKFTAVEWIKKLALLGNVCIYCGESKSLTIDHAVPLSRGGSNDISNLVPACGPCNFRKGVMTAQEFDNAGQHVWFHDNPIGA